MTSGEDTIDECSLRTSNRCPVAQHQSCSNMLNSLEMVVEADLVVLMVLCVIISRPAYLY